MTIAKRDDETSGQVATFLIKAYPNPTHHSFTLDVQTKLNDRVVIKVYDIAGRQVYLTSGAANRTYSFGSDFVPGLYIVEVRQGDQRSLIKLVKQ